MAQVQKVIITDYPDGSRVMSNIRNKKGVPVFKENDTYTATRVTTWYDGTPMDDSKADGKVYLKHTSSGDYYRVNLPNDGELFLEKDTVGQMRDLSTVEILLLKMGYYKGVTLNGYYKANDTPGAIQYYLSDTVEEDDGGSVFEVGGIKLEHEFIGDVDIRYFGAFDTQDVSDVLIRLNSIAKVTAAILPNNCILKISKRVNVSNISLLGGTNTVIQVVTSGITPLWFTGYKNKTVSNITFDGNNSDTLDNYTFVMVTGNSEGNIFENLKFINISSKGSLPSSPPLYLIAKDVEDDMGSGDIGYVKNNIFRNLEFIQKETYTSAFVIRAVTNWTKSKLTEGVQNRCEFNTFEKIKITGDYLWNMMELAGSGTLNNTVKDSHFQGRAITAIDLDKGASNNIVENNYVELSLSSYADQAESSFVFAAINNHGGFGLINYNNIIRNNKLYNCGALHINQSPLEACIGFQNVDGGACQGNKILSTKNGVCGIHFLSDTQNLEISGNTTKNIISRAITTNASQGGNHNNKIINNILESDNNVIFLSGIVGNNNNNIITGNSITCVNPSNGAIWVTSSWSNTKITDNYISNANDKIVLSGCNRPTVTTNTFDGISTYSIRTTGINENISDNNSVVSSIGLVGSSANTARQWNNSWNSSPIFEQPFYRNDNVVFGQDASIVPVGFWTSSKSITMSTISAGIGFPNSVGLLISYQNGGGETSSNYTRSFDIFKNYNEDGLYVRRYSPSGVPLPFRRLDNISAAASADSATTPSETYTQAEVQAILAELRDLKTKLRTAGILAT